MTLQLPARRSSPTTCEWSRRHATPTELDHEPEVVTLGGITYDPVAIAQSLPQARVCRRARRLPAPIWIETPGLGGGYWIEHETAEMEAARIAKERQRQRQLIDQKLVQLRNKWERK